MPRPRSVTDASLAEAAARVIGRVGPGRLTVAAVAAEAGLAPATVVQRFGSKRGLLLAVAEHAGAHVAAVFNAAEREAAGGLDALRLALHGLAAAMGRPEELANHLAFLQLDVSDPELRDRAAGTLGAIRARVRALLAAARDAGELGAGDPASLAGAGWWPTTGRS